MKEKGVAEEKQTMEYGKMGEAYYVRMDRGDEIIDEI